MGNHRGARLFLTLIIIPLVTIGILFYYNYTLNNVFLMIPAAFVIYFFSDLFSIAITKAGGGKSNKKVSTEIILLLIKSVLFAIGFTWMVTYLINGGIPLLDVYDGRQKIDYLVLMTYIGVIIVLNLILVISARVTTR